MRESDASFQVLGPALVYHAIDNKKQADAALAECIEKNQYDSAFQNAEVYSYRGETDKAFEWLERTYTQRDAGLSEVKGDPLLRRLEHDPRYRTFLKKMKLPVD